jgi:cyclophilin family peptidyl-prolyl cis-trans isomerase
MLKRLILATMATLTLVTAHAADPQRPQVRITTNQGVITIELYPDRAPLTVANFLRYVSEGQYTQTLFHRVIPNFLIQGGGFSAIDSKVKPAHEAIANESGNGLQNRRGAVGLARTTAPHSGDSQFFIDTADNPDLDPLPARWGYAVFGKVIDGMDVVDHISTVPAGAIGPFKQDAPLTPVIIEKVELLDPGAYQPAATTPQRLALPPGSESLRTPK